MDSFRRGMNAFGRGDVEAALEDIHPEVEFIPMRAAVQGAFHGHEGMRKFFRDNEENFESFHVSYPDVRHVGENRMVAVGTLTVRGKASGVEAEVPSAVVLDFRDGKLVRFEEAGDERSAMTVARGQD